MTDTTQTEQTTKQPKACLTCQHFYISLGYAGYSEMTPGSPGEISCDMSQKRGCPWKRTGDGEGRLDVPPLRTLAENCPYYEVHESLR